MTKLALPFLLIALAASAPAAPVPVEARAPVLFFPTTVGTKWTYRSPVGEETHVVTAVERKGGARIVSVGQVGGEGKVFHHQKVEVSAKGLYRLEAVAITTTTHPGGGTTTTREVVAESPPACLLKLPARDGDRWTRPHPVGRPVSVTTGREEEVRVPAGVFTAVPVEFALVGPPGALPIRERHWYAPGVGAVKWTPPDGGEVVLKSFTPGKD